MQLTSACADTEFQGSKARRQTGDPAHFVRDTHVNLSFTHAWQRSWFGCIMHRLFCLLGVSRVYMLPPPSRTYPFWPGNPRTWLFEKQSVHTGSKTVRICAASQNPVDSIWKTQIKDSGVASTRILKGMHMN